MTNDWITIVWPEGYIDNDDSSQMPLSVRPKCLACASPLRKQKEIFIPGTLKHRGRHLCEKCYQIQLDSGEFLVRARAERTDTHLKCMKCQEYKTFDKFKRLTGTFRVRRDYTCSLCRKLWERYSLTPEQYKNILTDQNNSCAICVVEFDPDKDRSIHVDHDHTCCGLGKSCGKCVRGLLCDLCNRGIGALRDSPENLRRAAIYLERHNDKK